MGHKQSQIGAKGAGGNLSYYIQLLIGVFLATGGASTRVMAALNRAGVTVSIRTVDRIRVFLSQDALNRAKELFRSEAKYYEPAGAGSWDVAMTGAKPDWRVGIKAGDTLKTTVTYDTRKASWYESMGIMVVFYADGIVAGAKDPFSQPIDWHGLVTHGHLKENDNHGGDPASGLPDARDLVDGTSPSNVDIKGYIYGQGDLSLTGRAGRPPVVRAGRSSGWKSVEKRA